MSLRDRCKEFYQQMQMNGMLRQNNPVEDLMAFVQSETGRTADERLSDSRPLVLYFGNDEDREEFVQIVREAKPGMITKKMP